MRTSSVCRRLVTAPCTSRTLPARAPRLSPARLRVAAGAAGRTNILLGTVETTLRDAEARVALWIAAVGGEAAGAATRFQNALLAVLLFMQRAVRWVQLSTVALQLQTAGASQQSQLLFAAAGAGASGATSSSLAVAASRTLAAPQRPQPTAEAAAAADAAAAAANGVINFLSAATTGAVEQLRHTLTDATEGIESKWTCIERTASSVQGTLFHAAQAHAEAMRVNPQGGMWKQSNVDELINEEERLRETVFAAVYAELLQKDNKSISFQAQH